jgi:hypothetical protein
MVIDFGNVTNTAATDLHLTVQYDVVVLNVAENADGAQILTRLTGPGTAVN